MRCTLRTLAWLAAACAMIAAGHRAAHAGGDAPPATQPANRANLDAWPAPELEAVGELPYVPSKLTMTPQGKAILSLRREFAPPWRVVVLGEKGKVNPFPNELWNTPLKPGETPQSRLDAVTAVRSDPRGFVWMLDLGGGGRSSPKLVAWDTRIDRLHRVIHLPAPVTLPGSTLNDFAVDASNGAIYIADAAGGKDAALIVVDLPTGEARRVLEGHASVTPEADAPLAGGAIGERVGADGKAVRERVGVNAIALDVPNTWLYFGAMHGRSLYRVKTDDLRSATLTPEQLAKKVERYCDKPVCDGMSIDSGGNIYLGDPARRGVVAIDAQKKSRLFVADEKRLAWPASFSFGNDGLLYTVSNPGVAPVPAAKGGEENRPAFAVVKFPAITAGVIGR